MLPTLSYPMIQHSRNFGQVRDRVIAILGNEIVIMETGIAVMKSMKLFFSSHIHPWTRWSHFIARGGPSSGRGYQVNFMRLPAFLILLLSLPCSAAAQSVHEVFDVDYQSGQLLQSGSYNLDLNADGVEDLLIVGYNSTGGAHSYFNFGFYITSRSDRQSLHTVRPLFTTSSNADCALRNLKLVRHGRNELDYKVLVLERTTVPEAGVTTSPVEFKLFSLQHRDSPGSPLYAYEQEHSMLSTGAYCSVDEAFDKEWLAISLAWSPQIDLDGQFEEPGIAIIPPGSFSMGAGTGIPGAPVTVTFDEPFGIGETEITFAQYDYFANETGRKFPDDNGWGRGNRPVINVTWGDAKAYVDWLAEKTGKDYRLPSQSEWEYAAKAGTTTRHFWGDTEEAIQGKANCAACFPADQAPGNSMPVASFETNAFGVYDMHGNVAEWVADDTSEYDDIPTDGSAFTYPEGIWNMKVIRGSDWNSSFHRVSSSYSSVGSDPFNDSSEYLGFRVAIDVD